MALSMNGSGQGRIIEGGVVPGVFNREQLGIFLRAKVVGENVRGMLTELALDDIGLVDGKADIKRLYNGKQFGKAQGFSFDSKALPGPLTINVTVQRNWIRRMGENKGDNGPENSALPPKKTDRAIPDPK